MKKYDIVIVEWIDICKIEDCTIHNEIKEVNAITIGFLLQKTKKRVKVVSTSWDTGEFDVYVIPTQNVINIKKVGEYSHITLRGLVRTRNVKNKKS